MSFDHDQLSKSQNDLDITSPSRKPTRVLRHRNLNRSLSEQKHNAAPSKAINNKKGARKPKPQKSNNLWDKCLKSNPELAQFVDNFNQSLEEALSKPLDISD